jgi:hypothetical protein
MTKNKQVQRYSFVFHTKKKLPIKESFFFLTLANKEQKKKESKQSSSMYNTK